MYNALSCHIRGIVPCITNNGRLADPTNEFSKGMKAIYDAKGRGKVLSDDKMQELLRLQFLGALYTDDKGHPCWPGNNLETMFRSAARKTRRGKDSEIGIIVDGNWPLIYDGPKDPAKLWLDENFRLVTMAKRGQSPVLTCRPIFHKWELAFTVHYLPDILNQQTVADWLQTAGMVIGLSDWRPKFGRFEVLEVKAPKD